MKIGKAGSPTTSISTADTQTITVRGRDLTSDLMGRMSFTEYFYLLTTGQEPTKEQCFFLDLLLVAIAEHGLVPTNQVARMTLAAAPDSLQGAVAAGILGCGTVVLGTAELCGQFLIDAQAKIANAETTLIDIVTVVRASGDKLPGFGHPIHKPVDPRTERIFALADEKGVSGQYIALARATDQAVLDVYGKKLSMNVSMAIAALLLDLDFPASFDRTRNARKDTRFGLGKPRRPWRIVQPKAEFRRAGYALFIIRFVRNRVLGVMRHQEPDGIFLFLG